MRRGILTIIVWLCITLVFTIHLIITYQKDRRPGPTDTVSERSIRQVKTTILERTERLKNDENADQNAKPRKGNLKELDQLKTENAELVKTIRKLKAENNSILKKEKQLKNLAKRLAAKLKGKEGGLFPKLDPEIPWVFAITPTYSRFTQKADLVRLSQTLMHVTNLHWIIVEDSKIRTDLVSRLLQESGLSFTHLNVRTPPAQQRKRWEARKKHHRGVEQRNLGLKWLRDNINYNKTPGAVYFMDDDNTYQIKIFDEMRWVQGVAVWPVGLAGGARWSGPVVEHGKVVAFHTNWAPERSFPLDMAGFAIGLKLLLTDKLNAQFNATAPRGFLEPTFLESLTTRDQLEPLADNCTKVYVWHTRTESPKDSIKGEQKLIKQGRPSDPTIET